MSTMDSVEEPLESRFVVSIEDISNVWAILKPVSSSACLRIPAKHALLEGSIAAFEVDS